MKPIKALLGIGALIAAVSIFGTHKTPPPSPPLAFQGAGASAPRNVATPVENLAPSSVKPREMYVGAKALNARASPNGKVIARLDPRTRVEIYLEQSQWGRISAHNTDERWVSIAHLCATRDCNGGRNPGTTAPTSTPAPATPVHAVASLSSATYRSAATSSGSGCSCSSGANCTGPRGGRYCITSGGNKRYR